MQQCYYCKRWFKNKQSVRAHLRWCPEWNSKKGEGFILPPGTIYPYGQPKSTPNQMDPNYPISSGGGFVDEYRSQRATSPYPSTQELIKSAKVCPAHYGCMICPHCGAHLDTLGKEVYSVPFIEGVCPACGKVFLY